MYLRKTLAFLRGMWYHQVVFGRVPLLGMGSGGAESRLLQLRGYSTVGSAIRSQRIGQGFESPYLHHVAARRILKQLEQAQAVFFCACVSSSHKTRFAIFAGALKHERLVRSFFIQTAKTPQSRHCGVNSVCLEGTIINAAPRKVRKVGVWRAADLTRSRRSSGGYTV